MSAKVVVTVPDDCRVSTSTIAGQVILEIEARVEGQKPGDPEAQMRFGLDPFEAITLGRMLQDRSIELLLKLAGYAEQIDKSPMRGEHH